MRQMHYLRLEIARCHNIRALLQDYYCTFKFKVAMAMDQSIERFKTLRVHCSVTFHPQQIETIFCLHMLQSLWRLVPSRIAHARNFFFLFVFTLHGHLTQSILRFFTGMDAILAMEFDKVPLISFPTAGFNLRNGTEAMICYRKRWI